MGGMSEGLQRHYEGDHAVDYERVRAGEDKWQRENQAVRELLAEGGVGPTSTVLDAPVGTGRFLPLYSEIEARVVGVDLSEDMLVQSRSRLAEYPNLDASLVLGDLTRLAIDDASVDIAVCVRFMNLVDLPVARSALAELARVSGGRVIFGLRVHEAWHLRSEVSYRVHLGRLARRVKSWSVSLIRHRKARPHPLRDFTRMLDRQRLHVAASRFIDRAADGAPYHIHLLEPSDSSA
jgi:SAM-dependent methyltransferase